MTVERTADELATWLEGVKAEQAGILRITDDSTREEIAEAITHCCRTASRAPYVIGTDEHPSAWDRAHVRINALLVAWETAT